MASRLEQFLDRTAGEAVEAFARFCRGAAPSGAARTYAIGDIHGCADLLIALLAAIRAAHPADRRCRLIFLGDLVDRGPDSAKAAAMVHALQAQAPAIECLRGNHEQMMIDWLRADDDLWLVNGGFDTIRSFGVEAGGEEAFKDAVEWMESLPTWREDAERIYVHAGPMTARAIRIACGFAKAFSMSSMISASTSSTATRRALAAPSVAGFAPISIPARSMAAP
jgi:hypothetical protein